MRCSRVGPLAPVMLSLVAARARLRALRTSRLEQQHHHQEHGHSTHSREPANGSASGTVANALPGPRLFSPIEPSVPVRCSSVAAALIHLMDRVQMLESTHHTAARVTHMESAGLVTEPVPFFCHRLQVHVKGSRAVGFDHRGNRHKLDAGQLPSVLTQVQGSCGAILECVSMAHLSHTSDGISEPIVKQPCDSPCHQLPFDLLRLAGKPLLHEPLLTRKAMLRSALQDSPLEFSELRSGCMSLLDAPLIRAPRSRLAPLVEEALQDALLLGFRGIVLKPAHSLYTPGGREYAFLGIEASCHHTTVTGRVHRIVFTEVAAIVTMVIDELPVTSTGLAASTKVEVRVHQLLKADVSPLLEPAPSSATSSNSVFELPAGRSTNDAPKMRIDALMGPPDSCKSIGFRGGVSLFGEVTVAHFVGWVN